MKSKGSSSAFPPKYSPNSPGLPLPLKALPLQLPGNCPDSLQTMTGFIIHHVFFPVRLEAPKAKIVFYFCVAHVPNTSILQKWTSCLAV